MTLHRRLLATLLCLDVLLIAVTGAFGLARVQGLVAETPEILHVGRDWSAGEMLNYVKWALMVGVLLLAWRRTGLRLHLGLAVFFLLVLADDSLQLHERGSAPLKETTLLPAQAKFLYGILVWAVIGAIGVTAVAIGLRDAPRAERDKVRAGALLFAAVMVFGVLVDIAHGFAAPYSIASGLLTLLEDGGEMVTISILAAYVVAAYRPAPAGALGRTPAERPRRA